MARDATTRARRRRKSASETPDDAVSVAAPAPAPAPLAAAAPVAAATDDDLDDLPRVVEAMLFAAHESLPARRIARAIGYVTEQRIADAIAGLARRYDAQRSPLMLAEIAGGWRLVTRPEYAPFLARLFSKAEKERLSQAALETLAIIAYRQPATRAEVEAVRGVLVGPVLRLLQEKRLIKVTGRAEVVGRALQYGTTRRFLDHFGLASIEELPKVFPSGRAAAPPAEVPAEVPADAPADAPIAGEPDGEPDAGPTEPAAGAATNGTAGTNGKAGHEAAATETAPPEASALAASA
jgi:segregation and condensation protein B